MYVFLDLETTGLNPQKDKILEIGILVLDDHLRETDSFRQNVHFLPYKNGKPLEWIPDVVMEMHEKNHLWHDCANSYLDAIAVQNLAIKFMESYKGEPMCGNTISFDRSFLQAQMPDLENMFHYRNIDISTFNVLFDKLGLETASKGEAHRALADCRSSVTQLKFYMKALGIGEVEDIIG